MEMRDGVLIGIGFVAGLIIALMVWYDAQARRKGELQLWQDSRKAEALRDLKRKPSKRKVIPPPPDPSPVYVNLHGVVRNGNQGRGGKHGRS